ncbi:MAG: lauroyl acyltransferase [Pseudomonadota bacterium]
MAKKRRNPYFLRFVRYPLEAAGLYSAVWLMRCLPIEIASNFGGWLGRNVFCRSAKNERVKRNLRLAFPEKTEQDVDLIARGMWDNLGRVAIEYAFLGEICDPLSGRVELSGLANSIIFNSDRYPCILASGHLANWEVLPVMAASHGVPMTSIIRDPNNPLIRKKLHDLRVVLGGKLASKGPDGVKQAMAALRGGKVLAMLIDQKLNGGIAIPFFGHPAMTTPAVAQLALRYRCPILLVRLERTGPARFRVTCHSETALPNSGNLKNDVQDIMKLHNKVLEGWIRERPTEWLWLHRRWPDSVYEQMAA